jgi:hypothetical protein
LLNLNKIVASQYGSPVATEVNERNRIHLRGEKHMGRPALSMARITSSSVNEFATADDFQRLFASDMSDLFHLAYLLTADAEQAEHCLILTMHECMASASVYKWWLPFWTRNALIRNGIRIATGGLVGPLRKIPRARTLPAIRRSQRSAIDAMDEPVGVLQLSDFDRLVYVICLVEKYSTRDCATLLGRPWQEVREARDRAVAQVSAFEQEWRRIPGQWSADLYSTPPLHEAGLDGSCGSLLG